MSSMSKEGGKKPKWVLRKEYPYVSPLYFSPEYQQSSSDSNPKSLSGHSLENVEHSSRVFGNQNESLSLFHQQSSNSFSNKVSQLPTQNKWNKVLAIDCLRELPDDPRVLFNDHWLFSPDHLLFRTPSRNYGISYDEEISFRQLGADFIVKMAELMNLTTICAKVAVVYLHRFYMLRAIAKYDTKRIGTACLFLASKFQEPNPQGSYFIDAYVFLNEVTYSQGSEEFQILFDQLLYDENLILQVLGFKLQVKLAHTLVVFASENTIEGVHKDCYTKAYKILNDLYCKTMLCLEFSPEMLASFALYFAAENGTLREGWSLSILGEKDHNGLPWDMKNVIRSTLQVYYKYRGQILNTEN